MASRITWPLERCLDSAITSRRFKCSLVKRNVILGYSCITNFRTTTTHSGAAIRHYRRKMRPGPLVIYVPIYLARRWCMNRLAWLFVCRSIGWVIYVIYLLVMNGAIRHCCTGQDCARQDCARQFRICQIRIGQIRVCQIRIVKEGIL